MGMNVSHWIGQKTATNGLKEMKKLSLNKLGCTAHSGSPDENITFFCFICPIMFVSASQKHGKYEILQNMYLKLRNYCKKEKTDDISILQQTLVYW